MRDVPRGQRGSASLAFVGMLLLLCLLVAVLVPIGMLAGDADTTTIGDGGAVIVIPESADGAPVGWYGTREFDLRHDTTPSSGRPYGFPRGSAQREVQDLWIAEGCNHTAEGFCCLGDGRTILVACKEAKFGKPGDRITWYFSNGVTIDSIVCDVKGADATSEWGHRSPDGITVLEFLGENRIGDDPYTTYRTADGRSIAGARAVKAVNHDRAGGASAAGGGTTAAQGAVVDATHSVPSPGAGLCLAWVNNVFDAAGHPFERVGSAAAAYRAWCTSSDRSELRPGMIVAVPSHPHTSAGQTFGHIAIYVGDGMVRDNIGSIREETLDEWIAFYGATSTVRWGWAGGTDLSR